jgi:hypothetical protein
MIGSRGSGALLLASQIVTREVKRSDSLLHPTPAGIRTIYRRGSAKTLFGKLPGPVACMTGRSHHLLGTR